MITLAEAKAQLQITHSDDDDFITALLAAAVEVVEGYTHRVTGEADKTLTLDCFSEEMELPHAPVSQVAAVKYYDEAGDQQTLDQAEYFVDGSELFTKVRRGFGSAWPVVQAGYGKVSIEYKAGYAPGSEPAPLKQAALMLLASLYEQRENHITGVMASSVPVSAQFLMQPYRIPVAG